MNSKFLGLIATLGLLLFVGCNTGEVDKQANTPEGTAQNTMENSQVKSESAIPTVTTPADQKDSSAVEDEAANKEDDSAKIALAKCLNDKGVKLYTAKWCGHCQKQKKEFGQGVEYLNNTDCAKDGGWSDVCKDANITAVPTWVYADGTVKTGETALEALAKANGCTY